MPSARRDRLSPWVLILLIGLLTHGIILLNDGVFLDGWLIHTWLSEDNWHELRTMFIQHGSPAMLYFHWGLGHLGPIVPVYRVTALLAILLVGMLGYAIGLETRWLSRTDAFWIALLAMIYPGLQSDFELINVAYLVCYALFLGGFWLAFRAERVAGPGHLALRVVALLMLFLSYTTNSLLVYHYGFLLLLFARIRDVRGPSFRDTVFRYLPRRLDYILLPVLFWGLKETFFPRHGYYANYNKFEFSPLRFVGNSAVFVVNGAYGQINQALRVLLEQPALVLLVALVGFAVWRRAGERSPDPGESSVRPELAVGFSLLLFVLGMFPYVAVGLAPTVQGFSARHSLLLGLPLAILLVSGTRLILPEGARSSTAARSTILLALAVGYFLATQDGYVGWLGRWVKDRSIIQQLAGDDRARQYSVIWVADNFRLDAESDYRFYEWASIFRSAWGNERTIGLDRRTMTSEFLETGSRLFTSQYNLGELDPAGCQALLTIDPGREGPSAAALSVRYLYLKYVKRQDLRPFLSGVTKLHLGPVDGGPRATHCTPTSSGEGDRTSGAPAHGQP